MVKLLRLCFHCLVRKQKTSVLSNTKHTKLEAKVELPSSSILNIESMSSRIFLSKKGIGNRIKKLLTLASALATFAVFGSCFPGSDKAQEIYKMMSGTKMSPFWSNPRKQKKGSYEWVQDPVCCGNVAELLLKFESVEPNLYCFNVDFVSRTRYQYYCNVTRFNPVYSEYLRSAVQFFHDVGMMTETNFTGNIFWRLEDDACMHPDHVRTLNNLGHIVVAHSVHVSACRVSSFSALVPNFHYIKTRGFHDVLRKLKSHGLPFDQRRPQVFWAGSTTGSPCALNNATCIHACVNLNRVKLVRLAARVPWLNMSLTSAVQWCSGEETFLKNAGLFFQKTDEEEWIKYRGILDIDGNVDAWGLYWRLRSGSVVFRVSSQYENFLSSRLVSGVHFVQVKQNLKDLSDVTALIKGKHTSATHLNLSTIAKNAEALLCEMTYESIIKEFAGVLLLSGTTNVRSQAFPRAPFLELGTRWELANRVHDISQTYFK